MSADDEGVWCRSCQGRMRAEVGRKFPGRREWLWWRCEKCGSVGDTAPLPLVRGQRPFDQAHLQSDPVCNDASTTAPSGSDSATESSRATLTVVR